MTLTLEIIKEIAFYLSFWLVAFCTGGLWGLKTMRRLYRREDLPNPVDNMEIISLDFIKFLKYEGKK